MSVSKRGRRRWAGPKKTLSVCLSKDACDQLYEFSDETGLSVSHIMREAVDLWFSKHDKQRGPVTASSGSE